MTNTEDEFLFDKRDFTLNCLTLGVAVEVFSKASGRSFDECMNFLVPEVKPDYAILEPTGNHYSRIWAAILKKLEIKVLWVGHVELRRYRGGKNLPNKSDPADALAMAAYGHDPDHRLEDENINLRYFGSCVVFMVIKD